LWRSTATGKEVWRTPGIRDAWNTPLVVDAASGRPELVIGVFGKILGIDPQSGEVLWTCEGIANYMCPSAVAFEDVVFFTAGRTRMTLAVRTGGRGDVTQSHLLWKADKGSNVSSPIVHESHLYFANDAGAIAYCLDAKTGKTIYEERLSRIGEVFASPVLAGGKLYYVGRGGGETVVLLAGPRFEELARNTLGEKSRSNASPAASDGQLFLRTERSAYCIGAE
jgi:outer membrane protein assembly factor BamB